MPPLPSISGARGRRLMRFYAAALGYAAGHCHITAVGDWYARIVAGWTGIVTSALVLLALLILHAQAERENWHTVEVEAERIGANRASSAPSLRSHPTGLD